MHKFLQLWLELPEQFLFGSLRLHIKLLVHQFVLEQLC